MQECVGVPPVLAELGAQGGFVFLLAVPKKIVERFGIPNDSFVQCRETDRHGALPGGGCGPSAISVSSPRGRLRADFVLHDLGRLRRQGQEGEEVAPADRIRTKPRFETPQRVLVLKQGDHDAFRRGMLALREPGVSAAGRRVDRRGMSSQDVEPFGLLALLEPEAREAEEHVRRTAADSQRPCGGRVQWPFVSTTQNRLPSGSSRTTKSSSGSLGRYRIAPRPSKRSTSPSWSSVYRSRCNRPRSGGIPSIERLGPLPAGSFKMTNGSPGVGARPGT